MPGSTGRMELWRRAALVMAIIIGTFMVFYKAPALVSFTWVDWAQEQKDEIDSPYGIVSSEEKRLHSLPLQDYINEKTGGRVTTLSTEEWKEFVRQVYLVSSTQYDQSSYGNRVSKMDKDPYWKPQGFVPVFFRPQEIPLGDWGLIAEDNAIAYLALTDSNQVSYLQVRYHDYLAEANPYHQPPGWLYHPYRTAGGAIILIGLLAYIFLPRRKKESQDISYPTGRLVAGDIVAIIFLALFYMLPFVINGGAIQAVTNMWIITLIMWLLALSGILLFYYSGWYSSYRIELTPDALYRVTFRGVETCRFDDIKGVEIVDLHNPKWFRRLFLIIAFISLFSGRSSPQPAGSALLAATASYGGLEIRCRDGRKIYLWFTDQLGNTIIQNFNRVPETLEAAGIPISEQPREIEGFAMFM